MVSVTASDQEFVAGLREAIDRYFAAVDSWESAYCRYYRMPGVAERSGDLAAERGEFEDRRRVLEDMLPRARLLCYKYSLPNVLAGLRYVSLGHDAPQHRTNSAVGRGERGAVMACLIELSAACRNAEGDAQAAARKAVTTPSLIERIVAFFS